MSPGEWAELLLVFVRAAAPHRAAQFPAHFPSGGLRLGNAPPIPLTVPPGTAGVGLLVLNLLPLAVPCRFLGEAKKP